VFAVWEPILVTDLARPISGVLHRMSDTRVRQYWDPGHMVADRLSKDARPPQPVPECCERREFLFDVAAVYPPGATWTDRMPTATVFNGAVVDIADRLAEAVAARTKSP